MSITKTMVSVQIDWNNNSATTVPFNINLPVGCHRINDDGSEELDVWYQSNVFEDKMRSNVLEFIKNPKTGQFVRVFGNQVSNRYNGLEMVLSDAVYIVPTTGQLLKTQDQIWIDDLTKEKFDENGQSYSPKQYEKKLNDTFGVTIQPAFTFFQNMVHFKQSMYTDMASR